MNSETRITRGFHRIGVVLTIPFLCTVVITAFQASRNVAELHGGFGEVVTETKKVDDTQCTHLDMSGMKSVEKTIASLQNALDKKPPLCEDIQKEYGDIIDYGYNFGLSIILLGIALVLYITSRAIGWVLSGFVGSTR